MANNNNTTKPFYNSTIPNDWDVLEFGDFAQTEKGKYIPVYNENLRCLELEHFEQGTGQILGWVNSSMQKSTKNKFKKGHILFGKLRPYLQKYWLAEYNGVCSSEVWVLNSKNKKCSNEFLFRLVQTNRFIQVANVSSGSKMPRADWNYVSTFPFPLPPLPEQKAIAHILGLMDSAINNNNQLITQKELRKKWLMQNLLTGKKRLKGFGGKWKVHKLGKLADIKKGKQLNKLELEKEGDYPAINGGISPSGYTDEWNTEANTITISEGGNSCGFINFITTRFWSGGHCYSLLNLKNIIGKEFLFQTLKYNEIKIMKLRVGSGLPNIQMKSISDFKLEIPPIVEQTAIAQVLQAADKEIQLLKTKTEKLKEQKKGMMQVLLTGKKRLNSIG